MTDAVAAFQQIAETQCPFVSRGDDSGTHIKEMSIWKKAAHRAGGDWYVSAGQGMGAVLTMANEQQAYTLERPRHLPGAHQGRHRPGGPGRGRQGLFNPYGVIAVNPEKNPNIQADLANQFIDWIVSVPTQEMIGDFGMEEFGQSLFTPDSAAYKAK